MDIRKILLLVAILAIASISNISTISAGQYPNLAGYSNSINFEDFAVLANNWLKTGSGLAGDFDDSEQVNFKDLKILCNYWLEGPYPEDVFELFKAALSIGDVNTALTFVAEISREQYRIFFQELEAYLSQMVSEMGELIPIEQNEEMAYYDLLREEDGEIYAYPLIFVKEEDGSWKIYDF
jgi:hypothetical protein